MRRRWQQSRRAERGSVLTVALGNGALAVDTRDSTARTKVLQMTILSMMRALRAVFCWTLRQEIVLLAVLPSTDLDHSPPEPPRTPLKPPRGSSMTQSA